MAGTATAEVEALQAEMKAMGEKIAALEAQKNGEPDLMDVADNLTEETPVSQVVERFAMLVRSLEGEITKGAKGDKAGKHPQMAKILGAVRTALIASLSKVEKDFRMVPKAKAEPAAGDGAGAAGDGDGKAKQKGSAGPGEHQDATATGTFGKNAIDPQTEADMKAKFEDLIKTEKEKIAALQAKVDTLEKQAAKPAKSQVAPPEGAGNGASSAAPERKGDGEVWPSNMAEGLVDEETGAVAKSARDESSDFDTEFKGKKR